MIGLRRKINYTRNEAERFPNCRLRMYIINKKEIKEKMHYHHQLKRELELFRWIISWKKSKSERIRDRETNTQGINSLSLSLALWIFRGENLLWMSIFWPQISRRSLHIELFHKCSLNKNAKKYVQQTFNSILFFFSFIFRDHLLLCNCGQHWRF